ADLLAGADLDAVDGDDDVQDERTLPIMEKTGAVWSTDDLEVCILRKFKDC
ncbi:unnamed protein product, partial [Effrenium voratum]